MTISRLTVSHCENVYQRFPFRFAHCSFVNLASWLIEARDTRRSANLWGYVRDEPEQYIDSQIPMRMMMGD